MPSVTVRNTYFFSDICANVFIQIVWYNDVSLKIIV